MRTNTRTMEIITKGLRSVTARTPEGRIVTNMQVHTLEEALNRLLIEMQVDTSDYRHVKGFTYKIKYDVVTRHGLTFHQPVKVTYTYTALFIGKRGEIIDTTQHTVYMNIR